MARTESTETLDLRWKRVGFVLFAVAGIAGLTIGYSLQRRAHDELGIQIKAVEKQTDWAKTAVLEWREKIARQRRREPITRQVAEMHLDLVTIVPSQRRVIPLLSHSSLAEGETTGAASEPGSAMEPVPRTSRSTAVGPLTGSATPNVRSGR